MPNLKVLILEFVAIDGFATGPILVREVAALAHEARDDAVEGRAGIAEALLAGAQRTEVLRSLRHDAAVETDFNAARRSAANVNIKVDRLGHLGVGGAVFGHELLEKLEHRWRRRSASSHGGACSHSAAERCRPSEGEGVGLRSESEEEDGLEHVDRIVVA